MKVSGEPQACGPQVSGEDQQEADEKAARARKFKNKKKKQ